MARAFVGVGSNLDPAHNVPRALAALAGKVRVRGISTFYRTPAEGRPEQPLFYNGVVEIATELAPAALKQVLRGIEQELGRQRTADKYAPRTIDLDLLLYDDLAGSQPGLTLPDPEIAARPFLAWPLAELDPGLVLPGTGTLVAQLARRLGRAEMEPLAELTARLRRETGNEREESGTPGAAAAG